MYALACSRVVRRSLLSLLTVLLLSGGAAAEWAVRRSNLLLITFQPEDAPFADRVLSIAETYGDQLIADIGLSPSDTIRMHIAETLDAFRTFTPGAIPDWGEGYAVPDWNLIVLKSPRITGSVDNLSEVVIHELAHILLHNAMRSADIPRWLDEGFAMYSARTWDIWDRAALMAAVLSDNLIPLSAVHAVNTFPDRKAQLAYQESALAVQFIIQEYGREGLRDLLLHLRATGSINQAFRNAFGISVVQFEDAWYAYMQQTYGWNAIPSEAVSLVIGPLFVVLFALSYITMRYRRRQTLKRWEQEEREEYGWSAEEDEWNRMKQEWEVIEEGKE